MLRSYAVLARVSPGYPPLQGRLPTCYSPVRRFTNRPKATFSLDLHVLSTPPAFILSQDQTLQLKILTATDRLWVDSDAFEIKFLTASPGGDAARGVLSLLLLYSVFKEPTPQEGDFQIYLSGRLLSTPLGRTETSCKEVWRPSKTRPPEVKENPYRATTPDKGTQL